jgi:hypothetical protein
MTKSLLYYTCPNEKCGKSDRLELDNGDTVVSHATLHNANAAMTTALMALTEQVVCYWCKTRVSFEWETIRVPKAVKYTPYSKLNSDALFLVEGSDLAGGKAHLDAIVEHENFVALLNRELGRLDHTHYPRDWKIRIAGKWLRSLITTWVKGNKSGTPDYHTLDVEYTQLMTVYIR